MRKNAMTDASDTACLQSARLNRDGQPSYPSTPEIDHVNWPSAGSLKTTGPMLWIAPSEKDAATNTLEKRLWTLPISSAPTPA
jgi:hypothetical protein